LSDGVIFGRIDDSFIAIQSRYALEFVPFSSSNEDGNQDDMLVRGSVKNVLTEAYDLVQEGPGNHYFVIELSDGERESFSAFKSRILANDLTFDDEKGELAYATVLNGQIEASELSAHYDGFFSIDGELVDLDYARYESPYVRNQVIARKSDELIFAFDGKSLTLNYSMNLRMLGD